MPCQFHCLSTRETDSNSCAIHGARGATFTACLAAPGPGQRIDSQEVGLKDEPQRRGQPQRVWEDNFPPAVLVSFSSVLLSRSVTSNSCDPVDCSTPGFPVLHQLPEPAQTHVHRVGDAIQPSHPLLSPSPPPINLA